MFVIVFYILFLDQKSWPLVADLQSYGADVKLRQATILDHSTSKVYPLNESFFKIAKQTPNETLSNQSSSTTITTNKSTLESQKSKEKYSTPSPPSIKMQRLDKRSSDDSSNGRDNWVSMIRRSSRRHSTIESRVVNVTSLNNNYTDNSIATAKYNFFTFIPKFLFEQFRKYANIFFLFIALMQQIPNVSPTGRYTTAVPLICIMFVSAVKEIFEDIKRHRADHSVNSTIVSVLNIARQSFTLKKWKDVNVGDLVLVDKDHFFPSDLVLFTSNEPSGICYIETSNLDGETNLKTRQAIQKADAICLQTNENRSKNEIEKVCSTELVTSVIHCDLPNKRLYEFVGRIQIGNEEFSIGPENVLLRGSKLRNTEWVLGCVIYTGHETKLMMNSLSKAPLKQSLVEVSTNRQILALLGILLFICLISAICSVVWTNQNESHWYLSDLHSPLSGNFFLILLTFIILYNNLIPISLQVTLEMVRVIQAHFINSDLEMYCEDTDTPAMARTSNLNEELGQV